MKTGTGSFRRSAHVATIVFAILAPVSSVAQSAPTQGDSPSARSGTAMRVDAGPIIDGLLDEAVWASAPPMTDFVQYQPVEGAEASEETEVRILFDGEAIYIGAWLFDREPEGIIVGERRRDTNLADADGFMLVLDTYHDEQTGFVFGTNPGAIEYDGQVRGEGGANDGFPVTVLNVWDDPAERTRESSADIRLPNGDVIAWTLEGLYLYPTPTKTDAKGGFGAGTAEDVYDPKRSARERGGQLRHWVDGTLNPCFAEYLMGFPAGYLDE